MIRGRRHLDLVLRGQAILINSVAVPAPNDALDLKDTRQLDSNPALGRLVGNPTPLIAESAVVEVLELVRRVVWVSRGSRGLGATRS